MSVKFALEAVGSKEVYRAGSMLASKKPGSPSSGSGRAEISLKTHASSGTAGQQHPDR